MKSRNPRIFWAFYLVIPIFAYLILQNRYLYSNVVMVMLIASGLYLLMAIIHHWKFKSLTWWLVLEYVLIVVLALTLLVNF